MSGTGTYQYQWSALSRATVFDLPWTVTVWGTAYGADRLADIKLTRSIAGKGFEGVATSCFSCDIYTSAEITEGAAVKFSGADLPTFYVASQPQRSGDILHIECYDSCKNLDIPFDYSGYEQFDKDGKARWYQTSGIISDIGVQCGFQPVSLGMTRMVSMCYNWIKGRTCRQILEDISKAECGFFVCSAEDSLRFIPFAKPSGGGTEIPESKRSEIKISGCRTISAVMAEDATYGTVYGARGDWRHTERISARFQRDDISAAAAAELAGGVISQITGYSCYGWECSDALLPDVYELGRYISFSGKELPVLSAEYRFTAQGIIARLGANAPDTSFSEYSDLYLRKIEGKVGYNSLFGCGIITPSGLAFYEED